VTVPMPYRIAVQRALPPTTPGLARIHIQRKPVTFF
jgi:hypothetical protein